MIGACMRRCRMTRTHPGPRPRVKKFKKYPQDLWITLWKVSEDSMRNACRSGSYVDSVNS